MQILRAVVRTERLSNSLGLRATIIPSRGELQLEATEGTTRLVSLVAASPTGVHMERVASAMKAIDEVTAGHLPPTAALQTIGAISHSPPAPTWLFALAAAAGAASLSVLYGIQHLVAVMLIVSQRCGRCRSPSHPGALQRQSHLRVHRSPSGPDGSLGIPNKRNSGISNLSRGSCATCEQRWTGLLRAPMARVSSATKKSVKGACSLCRGPLSASPARNGRTRTRGEDLCLKRDFSGKPPDRYASDRYGTTSARQPVDLGKQHPQVRRG
jgi:hypothetical protein